MEQHKWSTDEIDKLDFFKTLDILNADMEQSKSKSELKYIDEVFGT